MSWLELIISLFLAFWVVTMMLSSSGNRRIG